MPNSKIPNLSLNDTLNTSRLKFNQLLDSVGDISSLTRSGSLAEALQSLDSDIGIVSDSNLGTTASTLVGAIGELDGRLDSINESEIKSPKITTTDSTGTSVFKGGLTVEKDLLVNGNLTVDGIATLKAGANSNINLGDGSRDSDTVTFNAEVASHVVPDADATYDLGDSAKEWRDAYFDGTVTTDNLKVDDSATITNNLTVTGVTTVDSINVSHLYVTDSAKFEGNLTVSAATTFTNPVTYNSSITFADSATVQGNLTVDGETTFNSDVSITKDLTVDSNLTVNGITNLDSTNIDGFVALTGSMNVTENLTVGGQFTISGTASTTARYYEVLKDQTNLTSNRGGLSVFRETEDSALLQWNEEFDYWEAGTVDSGVYRLALQGDSATFTRLVASGTGALRVPRGTTSQRPSDSASASVNGFAEQGDIRYNSSTTSFEGYSGTSWGSLGGLIDVDQDTQIIAEIASGTDSDTLQFYTGGTLAASLDSNTLSLHTPDLKVFYSNDSATTISGGTITTQKVIMDSANLGTMAFTERRIATTNGGTITINTDSGADGEPHIRLQSLNSSFDGGKITLFSAGDIQLNSINNDIELDGTNIYLGDQSTSPASEAGLWVRPDREGAFITSVAAGDSSYITYGPVIDFHHERNQPYGEGSYLKLYADSIHVRRAGLYVQDALNQGSKFDGDVTVVGNLTVEGTTVSVNSTTVELGDRIIELNSEIDSAANPTQDAGIEINRGAEANAQLLFDESENYWVAGEGDSNTKARIVTTNYIKFPSNDALSLDSATGTISHTGRNVPTIDVSGGVKGINAIFDSNGHVTTFTVTEGGALTTKSGSGLSISGANDSDISIDSASLVSHYLEKVAIGNLVLRDSSIGGQDGSALTFQFPNGSNTEHKLFMYSEPDKNTDGDFDDEDAIVLRSDRNTDLRLVAGGEVNSSGQIIENYSDLLLEGSAIGARSKFGIYLLPGYGTTVEGDEASSAFVEISGGTTETSETTGAAYSGLPGRYGVASTGSGYGSIKLIPGNYNDQRSIIMSDADLVLRNNPDDGSSSIGIYMVSNSGDIYFRKDNGSTTHEGDTDPDLKIGLQDEIFTAGPSGDGHTVFYVDDSATFSIGNAGTFTIENSIPHSSIYNSANTGTGKPNGATLVLWGNETTPFDNGIIGEVRYAAENSSNEQISYASIITRSKDITNGTEDGEVNIMVRNGGVMTETLTVEPASVSTPGFFTADLGITTTGDFIGDNLRSNLSTFNLVDTTSTTINFGGAATTLNIGAATGTTTVHNNLSVSGTISGSMAYSSLTGTPTIPGASDFRAAQHVSGGYIGAVGQYRLARSFASSGAGSAPNTTMGGSNLGPADVAGNAYKSGSAYVVLGGSWRRMGYQHSNGSLSTGAVAAATTLYVRYA